MQRIDWLNRLAKWRSVFAGWQLGTRAANDPECQAVRDHREVTVLLRAEMNALVGVLIAKGIFTAEEFSVQLIEEAQRLCEAYEKAFPGFRATDVGIEMMPQARETTRHWKP